MPNVVNTGVALVAVAEARNWTGDGCVPPNFGMPSPGNRDLSMKVSLDGGRSWGKQRIMYNDGYNSAAVYDAVRNRVIIHFVDGIKGVMQLNCNAVGEDCRTTLVGSAFLGVFNHTSPGPGLGTQLSAASSGFYGRIVFAGHKDFTDVAWFSDDGGDTWSVLSLHLFCLILGQQLHTVAYIFFFLFFTTLNELATSARVSGPSAKIRLRRGSHGRLQTNTTNLKRLNFLTEG